MLSGVEASQHQSMIQTVSNGTNARIEVLRFTQNDKIKVA